jgi:glycosyltransferase involved in cell wall biosynthesis
MASPPLVSVLITAWNKERYLDAAIRSALEQTRPADEVLVVNDGSTDGTKEIILSYGSRVRLLDQENQGAARARNTGIAAAQGQYIAFLDADDVWKPHKLATQLRILEAHPEVALVSSRAEMVDEDAAALHRLTDPRTGSDYDRPRDWHRHLLMKGNDVMTSSVVVSKSALLEVGGFFDERRIVSHDYELWIRLSAGRLFWLGTEPLVYYRMLKKSLLHGSTEKEYGAQLGIISMHRRRYSEQEWQQRVALLYREWADSAEYEGESGATARLWQSARHDPFALGTWLLAGRIASRRLRRVATLMAGTR